MLRKSGICLQAPFPYDSPMYKYQSLEAWKSAHAAALLALEATDAEPNWQRRNLFDQLRRAAVSVEANIVEGFALGTIPLCRRHLRIAFGSAAEAECLARLFRERGYLSDQTVKDLEARLGSAMRALHGLMRSPPITVKR